MNSLNKDDNEKKHEIYRAEYPFIRDDFRLIAKVENNKQELIIAKIDPITKQILKSSSIQCIHTAVTDIGLEDLKENSITPADNEEFNRKVLKIRSSENLKEINLAPEEKFKAFKSWVAGISDAGINAIKLQYEIDNALALQYPISLFLMQFLVRNDREFSFKFLELIERDCKYEGVLHKPCLTSNSILIIDSILESIETYDEFSDMLYIEPNLKEVLNAIFELPIYFDAIVPLYNYKGEINNEEIEESLKDLEHKNRLFLISFERSAELPGFVKYFKLDHYIIKSLLLRNPSALKYDDFIKLVKEILGPKKTDKLNKTSPISYLKAALASNPAIFELYKTYNLKEIVELFKSDDYGNWQVRFELAINPNAIYFDEYTLLFDDPDWRIRRGILLNRNIDEIKRRFRGYDDLIPLELGVYMFDVISNEKAARFKEFKLFFKEENYSVLRELLRQPWSASFEEFKSYFESNSMEILKIIAMNRRAPLHEDYRKLFRKNKIIREVIASNPSATRFKEFKDLFPKELLKQFKIFSSSSGQYGKIKLTNQNDIKMASILASNSGASKYEEFRLLFYVDSPEVLEKLALNPSACQFPEYNEIILNILRSFRETCHNSNNTYDGVDFKNLLNIKKNIAANHEAARFKDFELLFNENDFNIKFNLAKNPNATNF
ncbi:MAG: hypothetical protein ACTSU2_03480, partial [Promethearchaeota archaeon]